MNKEALAEKDINQIDPTQLGIAYAILMSKGPVSFERMIELTKDEYKREGK